MGLPRILLTAALESGRRGLPLLLFVELCGVAFCHVVSCCVALLCPPLRSARLGSARPRLGSRLFCSCIPCAAWCCFRLRFASLRFVASLLLNLFLPCLLPPFASFCLLLLLLPPFASFCLLLHPFCLLLPPFASFCLLLPPFASFCILLHPFAAFCFFVFFFFAFLDLLGLLAFWPVGLLAR